jgi:HEAT repeat protein
MISLLIVSCLSYTIVFLSERIVKSPCSDIWTTLPLCGIILLNMLPSSTISHLTGFALAARRWQFDLRSALIGAAVAFLLVWLAYRFRKELRLGWEGVTEPVVRLRHRLQASAEDRYRELIAAWARSSTHIVPLDATFVEPEFIFPLPFPQMLSETEGELLGPRTLPLDRVLGGHPRLAILGACGMGGTALLAHLALTVSAVREQMPLYVLLSAMDWGEDDESDGMKKLLNAAVAAVGGGGRMVDFLRRYLGAGQAIVLADGWDELPSQQRQQAAEWLAELADRLPGNLWLVAAGIRGYAPLTEVDFVPLTIAPWDTGRVELFAERWIEACAPTDAESSVDPRGLVAGLRRAARRGVSPLGLALRAFVYISDQRVPAKRSALFGRALDLLLEQEEKEEAPWLEDACRMVLGQVALECQQAGRATAGEEELSAAIEAALPPPEERPTKAPSQVLRLLTGERGLFRPAGSKRYAFAHPLWRAYLAARQLAEVDPASLVEHLDDPWWAEALLFYAELGDMEPLVAALLRKPGDMFHTHLHTLSSWVSVAPKDAAWSKKAMAALARELLQPSQPRAVRQTLAGAIAATRMPGIDYFFKQSLRHQDADVRSAAVLGLGRVASESDLPALEAGLADKDPTVREASAHALTYLNIDAATRLLERIVQEADDTCRALAAEALAQQGEEGIAFLRKMLKSEDMMTRRAAVLGLARIGAQDLLDDVVRQEEQWIVHSAAMMALEELEKREQTPGVAPSPEIEQLPWLISWAAARGEGVGTGDAARRALWLALREGESAVRLAAVQILVHVGRPDDVKRLQVALNDPDPAVASTALEALTEISRRYDLRIEVG